MEPSRLRKALTTIGLATAGTGLVAVELATMSAAMAETMGGAVVVMAIVLLGASASASVGGRGNGPF